MRKGFDSLSGIVTGQMNLQVLASDVFVFINRKRTHIKLLQWEGVDNTSRNIDVFKRPVNSDLPHVTINPRQ